MTTNSFHTDLEYLYSALQKHPALWEDTDVQNRFAELYQQQQETVHDYASFIDATTELTTFFHDGHTNIEIPYATKSRCLPLPCDWNKSASTDLVLTKRYENIPSGSQITHICGVPIEQVITLMSQRIPHENIFLVKSRMFKYPYQNYHVFSEMNLRALFGEQPAYAISFLVDGAEVVKSIPLADYNGFLDFSDDQDFISYELAENAVILHLNSCNLNEKYTQTLEEIAALCHERQIPSLVLDLSQNMGGNSAVIDEFIKFTHVDSFRRYEMIDFSSGEAKTITRRSDEIKNHKKECLFPTEIYCKVSHNTFSSARTFAVTLKDNGIAKIIGTETGGKPNSYGMPKKYVMPESKIRFRVSRCYFMRPDAALDEEITLSPTE